MCVIADGVDGGRYLEPEIEADYCEQEPEAPNVEPALPEDYEDGKFNLPPLMHAPVLVFKDISYTHFINCILFYCKTW
jgi:hypothetical protein